MLRVRPGSPEDAWLTPWLAWAMCRALEELGPGSGSAEQRRVLGAISAEMHEEPQAGRACSGWPAPRDERGRWSFDKPIAKVHGP